VRTWEQPPSVYEVRDGQVVLLSGKDIGPVELSDADALLVALTAGPYSADDGIGYLKAAWATYCRGSRFRAEYF